MTAVPYTRAAVERIRQGASAADLGWSSTMYERVCRDHGIEPCGAVVRVEPEPPVRPARAHDVLSFDASTGEVFFHSIVVALSKVQASVFGFLFERHAAGDQNYITGNEIWRATGNTSDAVNVATVVARMNSRLRQLGISVESKQGHKGGYRLRVDQGSA